MKKLNIFLALTFFAATSFSWTLPKGGLDESDWNSDSLKGKTFVLFYVNPSKKNLNNNASEALKAQKFKSENFASVAIIDLKSTWIPNRLILRSIKKKQKKYPRTIYLKDASRSMHKILELKPKGNDILAFNSKGEEIFRHLGKLSKEKIEELLKILKKETLQ